jgi:hypothetical protein
MMAGDEGPTIYICAQYTHTSLKMRTDAGPATCKLLDVSTCI